MEVNNSYNTTRNYTIYCDNSGISDSNFTYHYAWLLGYVHNNMSSINHTMARYWNQIGDSLLYINRYTYIHHNSFGSLITYFNHAFNAVYPYPYFKRISILLPLCDLLKSLFGHLVVYQKSTQTFLHHNNSREFIIINKVGFKN
ncbi:MAG: hypothetical protein IT238_09630 [Bacteroidia bacterium]|nr:hypothetical protein [Bacteroidia bacterium]MCZ2249564.1 hypothetical protein [Bacteroidia bacterium]